MGRSFIGLVASYTYSVAAAYDGYGCYDNWRKDWYGDYGLIEVWQRRVGWICFFGQKLTMCCWRVHTILC